MATINQITVNSTTYDLAVSASNVSGTVANATTATKLGTATKGSATQPIYLSSGTPTACTYSLAKSVPADAKFTDTTYSNFVKSGSGAKAGLVPAPSTTAGTTKYLREDGTWVKPPDTNTTYSNMGAATASAAGTAGLVPAPAAGAQAKFLRGDGTWQTPPTSYTLPTASSSTLGGVKVGTGLGISSGTLSVAYGTTATTACKGNDSRLSDSRTPKAHAATATTYGAGTASNYGHVKLSDSYTTSGGAAAAGVAASSYALVTAYNTLNSKIKSSIKLETYSLVTGRLLNSDIGVENTIAFYGDRKLSDYVIIEVLGGWGPDVISCIQTISVDKFKNCTNLGLCYYSHSKNSSQDMVVGYKDETSVYVTREYGEMNYIEIIGYKFVLA
jgi:hypothetical protein